MLYRKKAPPTVRAFERLRNVIAHNPLVVLFVSVARLRAFPRMLELNTLLDRTQATGPKPTENEAINILIDKIDIQENTRMSKMLAAAMTRIVPQH